MADGVFNISKGAFAEKVRNSSSTLLIMLLTANEADATMIDYADVAALLAAAGNTESADGSYTRKTGLTGTITVDNTNDRVDVDIPDQTWSGLTGETMTKAIVAQDEGSTDATRVPGTHHDFAVTTDGSDLTIQFNASGCFRAA